MKDEIIKLKKQNKTSKEISEILNCSQSNVYHHLKKANLNGRNILGWTEQTKLMYARKIESYIALKNLKVGKLMELIGVDRNTYSKMIKRNIALEKQKKIEMFFR